MSYVWISVLVPKELQRHARAAELAVHPPEVRLPTTALRDRRPEQPRLELGVDQAVRQGPGESRPLRPLQGARHRPQAHRTGARDRPVRESGLVFESENLS
jgi:hypothetical protein